MSEISKVLVFLLQVSTLMSRIRLFLIRLMSKYKVRSYFLICHVSYTCIYTTLVNKQNNANLCTISEAREELKNYIMTHFKAEVQRTVDKISDSSNLPGLRPAGFKNSNDFLLEMSKSVSICLS